MNRLHASTHPWTAAQEEELRRLDFELLTLQDDLFRLFGQLVGVVHLLELFILLVGVLELLLR